MPTFRFKLTGCAAKLLLGYVMFPYYVVQSSLSLWSIGCKIDIFCKWLPQRHSNLWQHQQRFFSSVLQRRRRRATFYVFISQSLLSAPPFSFQSKNWPSTLSSSLLAECSLLTYTTVYYTENASIRHLTRITPLFKARIFKMDCQFDGNCKKGIHSGFRDRITALRLTERRTISRNTIHNTCLAIIY